MSSNDTIRAVLTRDGRMLIEQPDGTFLPAPSRTDWESVRRQTDAEIDAAASADPDALPLDDEFWCQARVVIPRRARKKHTGLRIDEDVLDWFRSQGEGYTTHMNAVLRAYMDAHRGSER